jgi:hypothetical protein
MAFSLFQSCTRKVLPVLQVLLALPVQLVLLVLPEELVLLAPPVLLTSSILHGLMLAMEEVLHPILLFMLK